MIAIRTRHPTARLAGPLAVAMRPCDARRMVHRMELEPTAGTMATVGTAISAATATLRRAGSPTPRLDAEVLLGHLLGRDRSWLLAHPGAILDAASAATAASAAPAAPAAGAADDGTHADAGDAESLASAYDALVARRAAGEPIAYIRGFKEWHSLRILTDPRALVPRPETELLADAAGDEVERRLASASDTEDGALVAWDVGTGSGAVAVVLGLRFSAALGDRLRIIASDASERALQLAALNLAAHRVDGVELRHADLVDPVDADERPDVVMANLPYVPAGELDAARGWLSFEPRLALDGGSDGLAVVRRFMSRLPGAVAPGASVFLEVGAGQARGVEALAPAGASVLVFADLGGIERLVRIDLPH